jgi:nitroreductase
MNVSDAINTRLTARAFLDKPVDGTLVRQILETAKRAPSGGNLQPWRVWVLGGEEMVRFKLLMKDKISANPRGEGTEYSIYPPELKEPYKSRRFKVGEDMYATIGVTRDDKLGRLLQFSRNFEFFGAPCAMFFAIDRQMQQGQWADLGMFMQSIMLLAREHGLHTASQEAWAIWHKTLGEFLDIPPELMLFCGMAVGYIDPAAPINSLRSERDPLDAFVTFKGL